MSFLRLKEILLFLFLLFIPTQLGRHFWPEWSYVLGTRVDYLSPTLYFLDLIWLFLFLLNWIKPSAPTKVGTSPLTGRSFLSFKVILLALFVVVNVLVASNKEVCVYRWLRLFQLIWTIFYLNKNKILVKEFLIKIIPIWIIFEGFLSLSQMVNGGSLNGLFYFLGERRFSFNTIGIAQMSFFDQLLVRAYGTFSHPNSLAGFVLVALVWWFNLKPSAPTKVGTSPLTGRLLFWVVVWMGVVILVLSGSRLIWLLSLVLGVCFLFKKIKDNKIWIKFALMAVALLVVVLALINTNYPLNNFIGGFDKNSFNKRWDLNLASFQMIRERTWTGYGLGNFLVQLPNFSNNNYFWLQPVHNVLLLILTESGVLGLGILIFALADYFNGKKIDKTIKLILIIILITSMWDHYWITLPQNWWLLVVMLGII
ncbi:MAG: O-antigen ligase family protein [Candidatus Shapirobacteria bacterium]